MGRLLSVLAALLLAGSCAPPRSDGLEAFASEAEMSAFIRSIMQRRAAGQEAAADAAASVAVEMVDPREPSGADASITNNQEAGVDEGGIVKRHGDILVVLRRGRLFTVSLAGGDMRSVDVENAFPPGVAPQEFADWYDEILVADGWVAVVGFSYSRGGTEIVRYRLSQAGELTYADVHQIRSMDYYSSENFGSRLIGTDLVVYAPVPLWAGGEDGDIMPRVRRWSRDQDAFRRIGTAGDIHVAAPFRGGRRHELDTLHALVRCDLTAAEFDCSTTGVLGGWSRQTYVSRSALYVWTSGHDDAAGRLALYRMPLDGGTPQAIQVSGSPINQFGFQERADEGVLHVMVEGETFTRRPRFRLLSLPLDRLGDGSARAGAELYRTLPSPEGDGWLAENRFIGDWLVYADARVAGQGDTTATLVAAPTGGGEPRTFQTSSISRIERLGSDALIVSGDPSAGALGVMTLSVLTLAEDNPSLAPGLAMQAAGEAETRSHAFFYRPDAGDPAAGVLGLPIVRTGARGAIGSAMLFLRRRGPELSRLGVLDGRAGPVRDGCQASCYDWYGDARPIFLGERVFALMGYELIEGRIEAAGVREVARLDFTPRR